MKHPGTHKGDELADRLASRSPKIILRDDLIEHGEFYLDPCNVHPEEAKLAVDIKFATSIDKRQLVQPGTTFEAGQVYCWTQVKGGKGAGVIIQRIQPGDIGAILLF